jgi:chemotaxis regulatin CheY-phosphate phosphatase CheZ
MELIDITSGRDLAEWIRSYLDQEALESLIENHDLQKVLKEDQDFQNLIGEYEQD